MSKTIWETLKAEGRVEGQQQEALKSRQVILLRQLHRRFKKVPRKLEARIDAATLADVGIPLD